MTRSSLQRLANLPPTRAARKTAPSAPRSLLLAHWSSAHKQKSHAARQPSSRTLTRVSCELFTRVFAASPMYLASNSANFGVSSSHLEARLGNANRRGSLAMLKALWRQKSRVLKAARRCDCGVWLAKPFHRACDVMGV